MENYKGLEFLALIAFAVCACIVFTSIVFASIIIPQIPQITNSVQQYDTIETTILSKEVLPSGGFSINRIHTTDGEFDVYVTNEMFISLPIGEPIRIYVRNGIVVGYSINKTGGL